MLCGRVFDLLRTPKIATIWIFIQSIPLQVRNIIAIIVVIVKHCLIIITCRTLVDLVIALGHIIAAILSLSKVECDNALIGCKVIGVINEIALVASNLWYMMLTLDLFKAIRNPFR